MTFHRKTKQQEQQNFLCSWKISKEKKLCLELYSKFHRALKFLPVVEFHYIMHLARNYFLNYSLCWIEQRRHKKVKSFKHKKAKRGKMFLSRYPFRLKESFSAAGLLVAHQNWFDPSLQWVLGLFGWNRWTEGDKNGNIYALYRSAPTA